MDNNEMHLIYLVIGDWGGDGHDLTEKMLVRSNKNHHQLQQAFKAGVEQLGFDITKFCSDFEEDKVPAFIWNKMLELREVWEPWGNYFIPSETEPTGGGEVQIDKEFFTVVYLTTCKIGDESLQFELCDDDTPEIYIGGYGLFLI